MPIGSLISAGANLIGGALTRDAQARANAANAMAADRNIRMQEEFAKKGIRWRVADAQAAGIHPLFAMGAQTQSFSPVSVGAQAETGMAAGFAAAGQDLSRAINATRTGPERVAAFSSAAQSLQLENAKLQNDLLRTQIASQVQRLSQNANPPMPSIGETEAFRVPQEDKSEKRQPLMMLGSRIQTDPGTSPAKAVEDVLGDDVFSPGFIWNLPGMLRANVGNMNFVDMLKAIDRATRIDRFWR